MVKTEEKWYNVSMIKGGIDTVINKQSKSLRTWYLVLELDKKKVAALWRSEGKTCQGRRNKLQTLQLEAIHVFRVLIKGQNVYNIERQKEGREIGQKKKFISACKCNRKTLQRVNQENKVVWLIFKGTKLSDI